MKRIIPILLLLLAFALMKVSMVNAQGWERTLNHSPTSGFDLSVGGMIETPNGGFLLAGGANNGKEGWFLLKTDIHGDTVWSKYYQIGDSAFSDGKDIIEATDGGYMLAGFGKKRTSYAGNPAILKVNGNGDSLWSKEYLISDFEGCKSIVSHSGNGYLLLSTFWGTGYRSPCLIKTDSLGDTLWARSYDIGYGTDPLGIRACPNGGSIVIGTKYASYLSSQVIRINAAGDTIWTGNYLGRTVNGYSRGHDIELTPDGGFLMIGSDKSPVNGNEEVRVQKIDSNGVVQWTRHYGVPTEDALGNKIYPLSDGGYYLGGYTLSGAQDGFFIKIDSSGNEIWRTFTGNSTQQTVSDILESSSGNHMFTGKTGGAGFASGGLWMGQLDPNGNIYTNLVTGRVFFDENQNCTPGLGTTYLANQLITAFPGPHYAWTDSNGRYEIPVDSGNSTISITLDPYWSVNCPLSNSHFIQLPSNYDTLNNRNFALIPEVSCPALKVNISTNRLRPCFPSVYQVHYENQGTAPAPNPYIHIDFDPYVMLTGGSITPPSLVDNVNNIWQFNLDSIPVGGRGSFTINVTLDCLTPAGITHCTEAHIFPDSICASPNPLWDESSVEVSGECIGDSVLFTITNAGTANMTQSGGYLITEDNIMSISNNFTLDIGDTIKVKVPGNGSTWALKAQQSRFHPGRSRPTAIVEACDTSGTITTGLVATIPMDDEDFFKDIDCIQNVTAFDPNDKTVYPNGQGVNHYISIDDGLNLEYRIRFQNTGTDTAYNVIIRDTLPEEIDPSTLELGVASAPYTFTLTGDGIAEWTFSGISLPDSNVNEPASHGFLTFNADRDDNLPLGSRIENRAQIYFDFEAPVATNIAFVTLGEEIWGIFNFIDPQDVMAQQLTVFPNPTNAWAVISLPEPLSFIGTARLDLYDPAGRRLMELTFDHEGKVRLEKGTLRPGIYLLRVETSTGHSTSARLVIY